jgi:hypothetical protein
MAIRHVILYNFLFYLHQSLVIALANEIGQGVTVAVTNENHPPPPKV